MLLNPKFKLQIFKRESWKGTDPAPYIEGCCRQFIGYFNTRPTTTTSDEDLITEPSKQASSINGKKNLIHEDDEYHEAMQR